MKYLIRINPYVEELFGDLRHRFITDVNPSITNIK
jgi:hypothetical protein